MSNHLTVVQSTDSLPSTRSSSFISANTELQSTRSYRLGSHASLDEGLRSTSEDDEDDHDDDEDEEQAEYDEEEDDPLGVKKLALSFDYLLYRISNKMEALAEQTELSVDKKGSEIDTLLEDVEVSMEKLRQLIRNCDDLDMEFMKLEQIGSIVSEFKGRFQAIERGMV